MRFLLLNDDSVQWFSVIVHLGKDNNVLEDHDVMTKSISKMRQDAIDKRRVSKLPTLPSAAGSLTGSNAAPREKGITKQTHEDAWALLQQSLQE